MRGLELEQISVGTLSFPIDPLGLICVCVLRNPLPRMLVAEPHGKPTMTWPCRVVSSTQRTSVNGLGSASRRRQFREYTSHELWEKSITNTIRRRKGLSSGG
jgi:hypothetical protein